MHILSQLDYIRSFPSQPIRRHSVWWNCVLDQIRSLLQESEWWIQVWTISIRWLFLFRSIQKLQNITRTSNFLLQPFRYTASLRDTNLTAVLPTGLRRRSRKRWENRAGSDYRQRAEWLCMEIEEISLSVSPWEHSVWVQHLAQAIAESDPASFSAGRRRTVFKTRSVRWRV